MPNSFSYPELLDKQIYELQEDIQELNEVIDDYYILVGYVNIARSYAPINPLVLLNNFMLNIVGIPIWFSKHIVTILHKRLNKLEIERDGVSK